MQFSQRLKQLMDQRGLTNYQLAKDLDVHQSTVAYWLEGKVPRKRTQMQIAKYFNVPVEYLMGTEEPKEKPLINGDEELTEYLEQLRTRPEMRMLFSISKNATKEDVERAVAIIEALRKTEENKDR